MKWIMKWAFVLIALVVAASALGCVGQKKTDTVTTTNAPISPPSTKVPVTPATTQPSPNGNTGNDVFGTETMATQLDSMLNDTSMDISLSDITI
jgi:hypothetical protein